MKRMRRVVLVSGVVLGFAAACGGKKSSGGSTVPGGSGSISGSVAGHPDSTVAASYLIGSPDDPATTVVYAFDTPVLCSDITATGWDTRITDGTQILEMKMIGQSLQTYVVATNAVAAAGRSTVNYTLSSTTGTPQEVLSSGGNVVLSTRTSGVGATGTFALSFPAGSLTGTYDAAFCAGGREP